MKIKRRFPNSFSGFEVTEHEVTNNKELLEIEWVKYLVDMDNHIGMFYSPTNFGDNPNLLMNLSQGNDSIIYFAVGYIFGEPKELGLTDYLDYIEENKNK
jgi:hypothetical protein|tara:strand:+ start:10642 stop:10941 length:300 start_codon:yes stop_codon:yes gene_type:complete